MNREIQSSILRACARFIGKRIDPLELRLKAVEGREPMVVKGIDGRDGKDATFDLNAVIKEVLPLIPVPKDGREGPMGPQGERGPIGLSGAKGEPGEIGPAGPAGRDGADADMDQVRAWIDERVKAIPIPRDGRDGKDAPPVDTAAIVSEVIKLVPVPKDGNPGADGRMGDMGPQGPAGPMGPAGEPGAPGLNGKDADEDAITRRVLAAVEGIVQKAIDAMPKPRDGRDGLPGVPGAMGERGADGINGKDGADALGFDDFDVEYDGERGFTFKWANGERQFSKSFRAPVPIYRGTFDAAANYEKDDTATYGGSVWIATKDAPGTPASGDGWKLIVKRGRDAKVERAE